MVNIGKLSNELSEKNISKKEKREILKKALEKNFYNMKNSEDDMEQILVEDYETFEEYFKSMENDCTWEVIIEQANAE